MATRILIFFILSGTIWLRAENYADRLLAQAAAKVEELAARTAPIEKLMLAEQIYYLSHESADQAEIASLLERLYASTHNQELKATIGYLATQQYRQLGDYDRVEKLVKELGYVSQWTVLGPLAADSNLSLKKYVRSKRVRGLGREVSPVTIDSYNPGDYWAGGLGHYGFFNANAAIYPNQLAGSLFTTWLQAPEKGEYRLGLGWANFARVWVNRTLVFEGKEKQAPRPDQASVSFTLKKGWHRLTLYIESESESPNLGFFARVTGPAGQPVVFNAHAKNGLPGKKPVLAAGEESLVELADGSPYVLATLMLLREQSMLTGIGSPQELLAKAFAEKPTRDVTTKLISLTKNPNERWRFLSMFLDAIGDQPDRGLDRAWAQTELGQIALNQKRFWEARKYAKWAHEAHPDYWPAAVLENNALAALDLDGEALRQTLELDKEYPNVPWILMDLADLYGSLGYQRESERITDQILAIRKSNGKFAERKIEMLKSRGATEELDRYYESILRDTPYSTAILLNYSNFLIANEKYEKAESVLADALQQLPENPDLLEGMGELMLRLSQPGALAFFERSLAIRPQNPRIEKILALSRPREDAFYMPYRMDVAPDVPVREVSPIVINFDNTVRKVAPNGQSTMYHQLEYEIINKQGAEELTYYSFAYAPLRQNGEVIKAEIYRGEQTIPLTRFGRSRISDPAYRMYYDLVSFQIPFPSLEPGDRVRVEYRIDDVDQTNIFGDYFGDMHYFADRYPIKHKSYTVIVPRNREIHYHIEKMEPTFSKTKDGDYQVYSWSLQQISSYETETRMPGLAGYLPYIGVSTFNDWAHMARWYKTLIEDQLILDPNTKAIVQNLTEGVTEPLEIVKKIHEYVVTNTRYVALEFGIHGYKPYQVNQVCTRQFGDCKDKASLIVAMLREAGIEANIVIVRTADRGEVHPHPAMLSYFNHAIAHVPRFDLFLDGTAEFSGVDELPTMDQGAMVLIVDKDGNGKLTTIPVYDNNHQTVELNVAVQPDGAVEVQGEMRYEGASTPDLRQYLAIEDKLNENVEALLGNLIPGLAVTDAERIGRGLNDPITLRFKGNSNRMVQISGGKIKLPLNILANQLTQTYAPNARRKFPLQIGSPKTRSILVRVTAPAGYELVDPPQPLEVEDRNFLAQISVDQTRPVEYAVHYQLAFKSPRIEPSEYASLRDMMQAHDRVLDQTLQFIVR